MKAVFVWVAIVLALVPQTCRAADALPDSQTLRDRSEAAHGPVAAAYKQIIDFTGTAASGTRFIYRRGADHREIVDAGPLHTETGMYGGDRWHLNANGHVVIDQDDPGLASKESLTTTVTRVSTPLDAYVIATLNAKGFGTREFFDPQTNYLVRREASAPNGKTITVYDSFRAFGARHLAAHWTVHDERTGTETQYTTREYAAGDVTESDIAMPTNKRRLVTYPAGQDRVVLPAVFAPGGHVLVRLTIAGRGLDFVLDTGASGITIDPGVAAALKLTIIDKAQSSENAGRFDTGEAIVPHVTVGALAMNDVVMSVLPLASEEAGAKEVGLLGFDFLCESGITIDYENKIVTAERYGTYTAPQDPKSIALDVRLGTQAPLTSVTINGAVAERMLLDTGGVGPFMLFDYFARRHPEALPPDRGGAMQPRFFGAGGAFNASRVELDDLTMGGISFKHFVGYRVTSAKSYAGTFDGLIGPAFLHLFDVHLDYPNGKIYLVLNATGRRAAH